MLNFAHDLLDSIEGENLMNYTVAIHKGQIEMVYQQMLNVVRVYVSAKPKCFLKYNLECFLLFKPIRAFARLRKRSVKKHKEFSVRKAIILSVRKLDQSNTTQM